MNYHFTQKFIVMKEKNYVTPEADIIILVVEKGFEASGPLQKGSVDNYTIDYNGWGG